MKTHLSLFFTRKGKALEWSEYSEILRQKCKKKEIPFHAGFELTPFCNFQCSMCYIRLDPEQAAKQGRLLTTEQWIYLAKEAKKLGTLSLEVTGGEAMTRSDFPVLYRTFIDLGFLIVLRTNGYLIDDEKISLFKQYRPCRIVITLYGASDRTYKKVCNISDGFSVVSQNILALRDAGLNVHLTTTITNENIDDVDDMKKWSKDHGFSLALCGLLMTPIREAKRSVDYLKVRVREDQYELSEEMLLLHRDISDRDRYMNPFWMCRYFGAKFSITWDGRMVVCNTSPSCWKDPFVNGLKKAYHDMYHDLKSLKRPEECVTCKYIDFCTACPSMLYSATGSMEETCDEICRMARRQYKRYLLSDMNKSINQEENSDYICAEGEVYR